MVLNGNIISDIFCLFSKPVLEKTIKLLSVPPSPAILTDYQSKPKLRLIQAKLSSSAQNVKKIQSEYTKH
jgi:hypothetical protein